MSILILAKEDYLGAGKAALRMYEAFKKNGEQVCLLVKNKRSKNNSDIIKYEDILYPSWFKKRAYLFTSRVLNKFFTSPVQTNPQYYFFGLHDNKLKINIKKLSRKLPFKPDLIIVTWMSQFFNAKHLQLLQSYTKASIIAYPMDMSLFTGGCHYAWECKGFSNNCSNCPAILLDADKHIANKNWNLKNIFFKKSNVKIIGASIQLISEAQHSSIFKQQTIIDKILLPIDETVFNANSRKIVKKQMNLETASRVVFFGASFTTEIRKGVNLFIEVLKILHNKFLETNKVKAVIVMLAGNRPTNHFIDQIPFSTHFTGYINDDITLSMAYQASSVFVCTSIQDSGPMMVNESVMCGTPVVAFETGVIPDLVFDNISGFKIAKGNIEMMAQKIFDILQMDEKDFESLVNTTALVGIRKTSYKAFYNLVKPYIYNN